MGFRKFKNLSRWAQSVVFLMSSSLAFSSSFSNRIDLVINHIPRVIIANDVSIIFVSVDVPCTCTTNETCIMPNELSVMAIFSASSAWFFSYNWLVGKFAFIIPFFHRFLNDFFVCQHRSGIKIVEILSTVRKLVGITTFIVIVEAWEDIKTCNSCKFWVPLLLNKIKIIIVENITIFLPSYKAYLQ